jgi:hypothetical protein
LHAEISGDDGGTPYSDTVLVQMSSSGDCEWAGSDSYSNDYLLSLTLTGWELVITNYIDTITLIKTLGNSPEGEYGSGSDGDLSIDVNYVYDGLATNGTVGTEIYYAPTTGYIQCTISIEDPGSVTAWDGSLKPYSANFWKADGGALYILFGSEKHNIESLDSSSECCRVQYYCGSYHLVIGLSVVGDGTVWEGWKFSGDSPSGEYSIVTGGCGAPSSITL